MTKDEALKLALEALEYPGPSWLEARQPAITAIKEALAQPEQEAMRGWVKNDGEFHEAQLLGGKVTYGKPIGILTKMEGDETMKLYPFEEALAQPEERYFCQRCGKRTADLTTIHTCTPPT